MIIPLPGADRKHHELNGYLKNSSTKSYSIVSIFFSLSFRYRNYRRELAYIRENDKNRDTPVKRFITNSGIDRKIVETLSRKEKLANQVNRLFTDRQKLREFAESL
jgi:hypothetical protein